MNFKIKYNDGDDDIDVHTNEEFLEAFHYLSDKTTRIVFNVIKDPKGFFKFET